MRIKICLLTLGLASTTWITGCQTRSLRSTADSRTVSAKPAEPRWASAPIVKVDPAPGMPASSAGNGKRVLVTEEPARPTTQVQRTPAAAIPAPRPDAAKTRPGIGELPPPAFPERAAGVSALKSLKHEERVTPANAAKKRLQADAKTGVFTIPSQTPSTVPNDVKPSAPPARIPPAKPATPPDATRQSEVVESERVTTSEAPMVPMPAEQANSSGATDSHRTLTGEVERYRGGWRIRYAAPDSEDAYGGSVSLEGIVLERIQEGQRVRVTGTMIPAANRLTTTRFQATTLEILER